MHATKIDPVTILLTGGSGLLGRALQRVAPEVAPWLRILAPSRAELSLTDRVAVRDWLDANPVDAVIHAAARVGGIQANVDDPSGFLSDNLRINDAVIMGAHEAGVAKLIFIGSSCMYPRDYRQPLVESDLLVGPLEPTNEGYALAKITGAKLCEAISQQFADRAYRTLIPCNLFGVDDHFDSPRSHLIAATISKIARAGETVEIWGDGQARREFLFADALAAYLLDALMRIGTLPQYMNIGAGRDYSVLEFYQMTAKLMGWQGRFSFDTSRPVGMRAKLMSSELAQAHGWTPPASIETGLQAAIAAYRRPR